MNFAIQTSSTMYAMNTSLFDFLRADQIKNAQQQQQQQEYRQSHTEANVSTKWLFSLWLAGVSYHVQIELVSLSHEFYKFFSRHWYAWFACWYSNLDGSQLNHAQFSSGEILHHFFLIFVCIFALRSLINLNCVNQAIKDKKKTNFKSECTHWYCSSIWVNRSESVSDYKEYSQRVFSSESR